LSDLSLILGFLIATLPILFVGASTPGALRDFFLLNKISDQNVFISLVTFFFFGVPLMFINRKILVTAIREGRILTQAEKRKRELYVWIPILTFFGPLILLMQFRR
jgi:hypothetical protein